MAAVTGKGWVALVPVRETLGQWHWEAAVLQTAHTHHLLQLLGERVHTGVGLLQLILAAQHTRDSDAAHVTAMQHT